MKKSGRKETAVVGENVIRFFVKGQTIGIGRGEGDNLCTGFDGLGDGNRY